MRLVTGLGGEFGAAFGLRSWVFPPISGSEMSLGSDVSMGRTLGPCGELETFISFSYLYDLSLFLLIFAF